MAGNALIVEHFGLTDMMPVFIFLDGWLDIIPTIDALVDCGYNKTSEYRPLKQQIEGATQIIILMSWKSIPVGIYYK